MTFFRGKGREFKAILFFKNKIKAEFSDILFKKALAKALWSEK